MTAADILKDLKSHKPKPLYLLQGDESYYIDQISNYFEREFLNEAERSFNQTVFYGKDTDTIAVLNAAKRYPMMADYQIVLIKEAQEMKWGSEDDGKKHINPFLAYLENPLGSTVLIFCYKYGKLDKRKKSYRAIEKNGIVFDSPEIRIDKIPAFIENYISQKNYQIKPPSAALLADYLGNDLSKITNEIAKLMLNVKSGTEITAQDIQDNIGISKDYNVYELQNALSKRDVVKANRIINYFEANPKANPFVLVLGNLYYYFVKILRYHYLPDKSPQNVAKALGMSPYFVKDFEQASRTFNFGKTFQVISLLREYDLKSKGVNSIADNGDLMKELVFKILH